MNIKKDIESLIGGIDEFNEKYVTYRAQTLRTILIETLDYIKLKEEELQSQRDFITQEQRKIYCVAYDKDCETDNECKQKNCVFKDRLKYKQAFDEIEKVLGGYYSNGISEIPQSQTELTISLLTTCEAKLQKILSITQEIKNN